MYNLGTFTVFSIEVVNIVSHALVQFIIIIFN